MARARSTEPSDYEGDVRGAAAAAPRSTPPGQPAAAAPPVALRSFLRMLESHQHAEVAELRRLLEIELAPDGADLEAEALLAVLADAQGALGADEGTYRLLVGVLLHSPGELQALRAETIAPVERYDLLHDTELVATLENFLAHDGSTSDTAEAMELHRHTVGYRLSRIHEVSGLSPYESGGRERLSLGLKARRVVLAEARRALARDLGS